MEHPAATAPSRKVLVVRPIRRVILLLACAVVEATSARASTVTVPDDLASIQAALDSRSDTVLIRPGNYPETVVVSEPGILLMGSAGEGPTPPTIAGLRVEIYRSGLYPALYAFKGITFLNPVVYYNNRNNADIAFSGCELRGGMVDTTA